MTPCTQPYSFLRLERFALGEIEGALGDEIRDHVGTCAFCGGHLDDILADQWRLDPLPAPRPRSLSWLAIGAPMLAAAVILVMLRLPAPTERSIQIKGGELAMTLVRERGGSVVRNPRSFEDGDRFEVRVTCPPGGSDIQVVVFQEGETFFPLGLRPAIACGNDVPLARAFALTGPGDAEVCVTTGETPVHVRADLDPAATVCAELEAP